MKKLFVIVALVISAQAHAHKTVVGAYTGESGKPDDGICWYKFALVGFNRGYDYVEGKWPVTDEGNCKMFLFAEEFE